MAGAHGDGLVVVSAYAGLLMGASIGMAEAASELAVPPLLALAGALIGTAFGLVRGGGRRDGGPRRTGRPPPAALAKLPSPAGEGAPGWYTDPLGGASPRLWDGHAWTRHRWR